MKKLIALLLIVVLLLTCTFTLIGCGPTPPTNRDDENSPNGGNGDAVTPPQSDVKDEPYQDKDALD